MRTRPVPPYGGTYVEAYVIAYVPPYAKAYIQCQIVPPACSFTLPHGGKTTFMSVYAARVGKPQHQ